MDTRVLETPALAAQVDTPARDRSNAFTRALFFAGKLIVSAACFWYALRQIDVSEAVRTLPSFDSLSPSPWRKSRSSRCACSRSCMRSRRKPND
jgi:hypothetical protein